MAAGKKDAEPQTSKTCTMLSAQMLLADCASAIVVSGLVGIPISIIDFSVMAKVSGVVPSMGVQIKAGVKALFTNPAIFFLRDTPTTYYNRVYRLCFTVYLGTYITANCVRSISEGYLKQAPETVAWNCGIASSIANTLLTIWKDINILRVMPASLSGAKGSNYIPMLSRGLFALRDTVTCLAAFTVVPLFKDYLMRTQPTWSEYRSKTTASLATPCAIQFLTTAIHIPAIKYQRMYQPGRKWGGPEGYMAGCVGALKADYAGAVRLRVPRIFFAYGLGTLLNTDLRAWMIKKVEPSAYALRGL